MLTGAVLIATYRRPLDLERCLNAVLKQSHPAKEVLVVARQDEDEETWNVIHRFSHQLPLRSIPIDVPGIVQALNAGLTGVTADVVAITDDDAAPHADWLERIMKTFAENPGCGGVGGRDIMHIDSIIVQEKAKIVGIIPKIGRMHGKHHSGYGDARRVDVLKGVNGAYRTELLRRFPPDFRLRGRGAQVHWEVGIGLAMRAAGYSLIYDPQIVVDHYLAQRFDEDQRNQFHPEAQKNEAFNEFFLRLQYLNPTQRVLQILWGVLIGTTACPGLLQCIRYFPSKKTLVLRRFVSTADGILQAAQQVKNASTVKGVRPTS